MKRKGRRERGAAVALKSHSALPSKRIELDSKVSCKTMDKANKVNNDKNRKNNHNNNSYNNKKKREKGVFKSTLNSHYALQKLNTFCG